jgi:hypothetical protein
MRWVATVVSIPSAVWVYEGRSAPALLMRAWSRGASAVTAMAALRTEARSERSASTTSTVAPYRARIWTATASPRAVSRTSSSR